MLIDWNHFTPLAALAGGVVIGLAASLLILLNGRIAGVCGIISGLLRPQSGDFVWRVSFAVGLIASPLIWQAFASLPATQIDADFGVLATAGFLVGIGTRYGSGCTSGHGVCGISRLSPRSVVATLAFMSAGFLTVYGVRHVWVS